MQFSSADGLGNFDDYFAYIESIKPQLPPHIYQFAANINHYNLTSSDSLHDAWLEYLTVKENASGERKEIRTTEIETCYLGPYHNCRIFIVYKDVLAYDIHRPQHDGHAPNTLIGHGDLLAHEIRLIEPDLYEHELTFSKGSTVLIQFRDLAHRIEPYHYR